MEREVNENQRELIDWKEMGSIRLTDRRGKFYAVSNGSGLSRKELYTLNSLLFVCFTNDSSKTSTVFFLLLVAYAISLTLPQAL